MRESQNGCYKKTKHAKFSGTYLGIRNVSFLENLACFVFLQHPFWDSPFCLITDDLWLRLADICKKLAYIDTRNMVISLMRLIQFNHFYCLQGGPGSLSTSNMEFFARIVNSWKLLLINYCHKQSCLRCRRVSEFTFDNLITISTGFFSKNFSSE